MQKDVSFTSVRSVSVSFLSDVGFCFICDLFGGVLKLPYSFFPSVSTWCLTWQCHTTAVFLTATINGKHWRDKMIMFNDIPFAFLGSKLPNGCVPVNLVDTSSAEDVDIARELVRLGVADLAQPRYVYTEGFFSSLLEANVNLGSLFCG